MNEGYLNINCKTNLSVFKTPDLNENVYTLAAKALRGELDFLSVLASLSKMKC